MISPKENAKTKEPFRDGLFHLIGNNTGHLIGTRCDRCRITFFPSRGFCSNCFQNDQIKEVSLSKTGTLYTYTTVYQGKPNFKVPYTIGYVDLKEGVRIFAPLFDVAPEELKIGIEMELVFRNMAEVSDQSCALVYGFRPAQKKATH
jgi:uncharacterized OB-fold protein